MVNLSQIVPFFSNFSEKEPCPRGGNPSVTSGPGQLLPHKHNTNTVSWHWYSVFDRQTDRKPWDCQALKPCSDPS